MARDQARRSAAPAAPQINLERELFLRSISVAMPQGGGALQLARAMRDASFRAGEIIYRAGDFTRLMQRNSDPFAITLQEAMNRAPKTARVEELASAVVYRMEQFGIMAMPVTDDSGVLVGVIHLHDLMRAGVA